MTASLAGRAVDALRVAAPAEKFRLTRDAASPRFVVAAPILARPVRSLRRPGLSELLGLGDLLRRHQPLDQFAHV